MYIYLWIRMAAPEQPNENYVKWLRSTWPFPTWPFSQVAVSQVAVSHVAVFPSGRFPSGRLVTLLIYYTLARNVLFTFISTCLQLRKQTINNGG
jgi:hypothetical protein